MSPRRSPAAKSLEAVISSLGTAARRCQLVDRGFSDWHIQQALTRGSIRRVGRGVYAVADSTPLADHLARNQAVPTCFARAKELGLWVLHTPGIPHVGTVHGRPVPGYVTHRYQGTLRLRDILRHCARCGSDVEVLCVLESAVVLGHCTILQLKREFNKRKDGRVRRLVAMIDPQSMSIAETCARFHLITSGHNVQIQFHIRKMGHLDAMVDGQLGLEIDGEEYHNDPQAWTEDLRRNNVLTVEGVPTLHFRAAVAMYFPDEMLMWIDRALRTINAARH